ncbi:unnamed protein product [Mytilus coruscus]|uniref:DDE Tnp4 domain-containing protein n=1 Tax=Mytilus coruscus TaxID=42192 RepID=A0A6J8BCP4_MYTCO|nr:unnamed protein product [Mytilus coruscus]
MKTVMNSPQIRQGIATYQPNDDDDPDFLAEETLPSELISPKSIQTLPSELISPKSIQLNLSSTSKSHRRCTVCQKNSSNRHQQVVVPHEARTQAFIEKCIVIPANSRCCPNHLLGNYFTQESISKIPEGAKQQTVDEANTTRLVTKVRWVVESTNGRIKQWKFLDEVVANHYVPHIGDFVRIVFALVNSFRPPLINDFGNDDIGKEMIEKAQLDNRVKTYVKENNLLRRKTVYKEVDGATELDMFPRISLDHLD